MSKFPLGEDDQIMWSEFSTEKVMGVALIFESSLSGKEKEQPCQSQPEKPVISFKVMASSPLFRGPSISPLRVPLSSHLSYQKDSRLSFPTIHLEPFLKIASPLRIAAQVVEHVLRKGRGPKALQGVLYLWERTLTHKEEGLH